MKFNISELKRTFVNNKKVVENYFFMTLLLVLNSFFGLYWVALFFGTLLFYQHYLAILKLKHVNKAVLVFIATEAYLVEVAAESVNNGSLQINESRKHGDIFGCSFSSRWRNYL